jgi:hypothetical protein
VLPETNDRPDDAAFGELLKEEREEGCREKKRSVQRKERKEGGRNEPMKKTMKIEMTQRLIQS